jgi:L-iditol 2-dehydrogenase
MTAAVMNQTARLTLEKRPVPAAGAGDVLVKVAYVGVCGSDMALFENGYIGDSVVTAPMVLGHEASGVVVALGGGVTSLAVGDRVALEPGVPCGACDFCREGLYNLCPEVFFWASLPATEGALQEYVRHPAAWCHRLPDSVSLLEGALIEPLSVGFHAVRQAGPGVGDRALVLGAGCVGLLTTLTLRAAGVRDVMVADLMPNRLELAEGLGGHPLDADGLDRLDKEVAAAPSAAPRYVFETAGNAVTMDRAISLCRPGGTVSFVGYTKSGRADLNVNLLIDKELTVRTVFRYRGCYPPAIAAVASGAIPADRVVSNVFPFDQAQAAIEHAIRAKANVTKCVIAVDPEWEIQA